MRLPVPELLHGVGSQDGRESGISLGLRLGEGAIERHPALMASITLVTGILTAGVLLSLLYLWVGFHRELARAEPAPWVETNLELPAVSEFQTNAPPVGVAVER